MHMLIQNIDSKLYKDFKSTVYGDGYKTLREGTTDIMRRYIDTVKIKSQRKGKGRRNGPTL